MEGIISQRVTPILKCIVLFLFIFTAKVLTSRPHESQDSRNDILHQLKPLHYVRTFTKYHHRRTIAWNNQDMSYWPTQNHPKAMGRRSVDIPNSNDLINHYWPLKQDTDFEIVEDQTKNIKKRSVDSNFELNDSPLPKWSNTEGMQERSFDILNPQKFHTSEDVSNIKKFTSGSRDIVGSFEKTVINSNKDNYSRKNVLLDEIKKTKVKAAMVVTDPPTTMGPSISCLYKIHSVSKSVTPSYDDERNAQLMVENDSYITGPIMETTLENGDTVEVELCMHPRPSCYTLWHRNHDGNITILGQGCWHSSQMKGRSSCNNKCTPVNALLPGSKFCCCTQSFCNADFLSLKEETVTMKAESTMDPTSQQPNYSNVLASSILALVALLVTAFVLKKFYCKRTRDKEEISDCQDVEKGDVMGSGPDSLATGLLCVDNLTLIEHIGQGKFGSVWRGSLGSTPVAVKLYSSAATWQKEAAVYSMPHLSHANILRYYGSDTRPTLTDGGRDHLIVLELCPTTLRARLEHAPITWMEFATIAHGLASALAHLHTPTPTKPCVVHRDVNSSNVLITGDGQARLADLGLAQTMHPRKQHAPNRIAEAGTLRYLSPEALEGALDLSGARAALCAVDVFALALVLWEMVWRCEGAHRGPPPPYAAPYSHHGLPSAPTLHQMQSLVSRKKARPPLPRGPVPEPRALRLATDTCDECWDHDAEARLTAVCVEERMAELKQMLQSHGPVIHDNNLHPHPPDVNGHPEVDKNSNCTSTQNCDVTTPLLYPQPHIGRNACIERNTHTNTQSHTVELIHKSLKDITAPPETPRVQNVEENCLSMARITHRPIIIDNSDRLNEIRSYQRPLDYVPNDVSSHDVIDRGPKQTNLLHDVKIEKPKWGIKRFFEKLNRTKETEVKLIPESTVQNGRITTTVVEKPSNINYDRPSNLVLNQDGPYNFEIPCTLSPPNRTLSPTMMLESELNRENKVFGFKELTTELEGNKTQNQIFAVIVPKAKPNLVEMRSKTSKGSSESINKFRTSMSSQSIFKTHSESEDSTVKKRLSCDNKIITNSNSGRSSRASINLELQYINTATENYNDSPFEVNSDCSSSEDEHLMLLSENGGSKITMQAIPKPDTDRKRYQNEVLKEASQVTDFGFNKYHNKYTNFDNEFSDPNDKENLVNGYSGDNPVYIAALNGELDTTDLKFIPDMERSPKSPKLNLKSLAIKRQHSLEQVSEIFSSSGDVTLQNPAGRVKTPGDLPVAVRRARRDRALQKGRASECNRLSLYDDRMMFGNSL